MELIWALSRENLILLYANNKAADQPIIALYFELENELKFYNLEASLFISGPYILNMDDDDVFDDDVYDNNDVIMIIMIFVMMMIFMMMLIT